eukprot:6726258-Prymnesium_polylepis.1
MHADKHDGLAKGMGVLQPDLDDARPQVQKVDALGLPSMGFGPHVRKVLAAPQTAKYGIWTTC